MNNLIPFLVVIPLGVAFAIPLAVRVYSRLGELLSILTALTLVVISLLLPGQETIYHVGSWPTPDGIDLRVDGLSKLMLLIISGLALVVGIYSIGFIRKFTGRYRYYTLLMLMVTGMNGVVLSGDLFNLYIFVEIATIASYALVAFGGEHEDLEASFKYAVLGGLSSSVILVGIALVYGMTGTLNLTHLASRLDGHELTPTLQMALALLFCGFGLKSALVPFHTWLPDAYPAAPAPISAILSGITSKAVGLYVLVRLLFNVFGITDDLLLLLRWSGGITMVVGALLALGQWNIKRLFAYSSVSQVGLIVLAFGFGTTAGIVGALFHLVNHAVFKPLLFFNSGAIELAAGTRDLRKMRGLSKRIPVTAATCMVGSLSISGIPPFNGFWSKLIIVVAGVNAGFTGWACLVVLTSIATLAYQFKVQTAAFFGSDTPSPEVAVSHDAESVFMVAPMIILAIGCGALSLFTLTGLDEPFLVASAAKVLIKGVFTW